MGFPLLRLLAFAAPYRGWLAAIITVSVLVTGLSVAEPVLVKYAIDSGLNATGSPVSERLNAVYLAVALYMLVNVGTWVLGYVQTYGMGWIGQHVILDLRNALFGHLQSLSLQYFSEQKAGWIISRLTNDIENFNQLLNDGVQNLIKNGLTLLGVFAVIFFLD